MDISLKITKENKDGSADAVVNFDKQGLETLVQWGLVAMLTKAIDEYKVRDDETEESIQPKPRIRATKTKPMAKTTKKANKK